MKAFSLSVCCLLLAGCCCGSKPASGGSATGSSAKSAPTEVRPTAVPKPAPEPVPDVTVTAVQLYKDYEANEVSADEQYKDKLLLVTGTVKSIDKDFLDNIVLLINSGDPYGLNPARATIRDSEKGKAMKVSKGSKITLECTGGGAIMHSPTLRNCLIR